MCALSCCGPMFESCESRPPNDNEYLYRWLEALLASTNSVVNDICEETLCLILHLNEHNSQLFEWAVHICSTKSDIQAQRCFRALALLFSKQEFPCEFISLLALCQVFALDDNTGLQQTALLFLQL